MYALGTIARCPEIAEDFHGNLQPARYWQVAQWLRFVAGHGVAELHSDGLLRCPQTPWGGGDLLDVVSAPSIWKRSPQDTPGFDDVIARDDPDAALIAWIEQEEMLFRRFERHIVEDRLKAGFMDSGEADVNGFLKFSISVQNRRKSRMGQALENHLEEVFFQTDVRHVRGAMTENKAKPDFLFPGVEEYQDETFPDACLTMLGSKSSCKERWRQVLPESRRIKNKHLFTLEPGISEHQTGEMQAHNLQLVLPRSLHNSYHPAQQDWLMNLQEFLELVKDRESKLL